MPRHVNYITIYTGTTGHSVTHVKWACVQRTWSGGLSIRSTTWSASSALYARDNSIQESSYILYRYEAPVNFDVVCMYNFMCDIYFSCVKLCLVMFISLFIGREVPV